MTTAIVGRGSTVRTVPSRLTVQHGSDMYVSRPAVSIVTWIGSVPPAFADPTVDLLAADLLATPLAVAEWTPDLITGLLWWNPRDAASLTEVSGGVSAWVSHDGTHTLTGASGSRPVRGSAAGRTCLTFSGSQYLTMTDALPDGEPITIVVAGQSTVYDDDVQSTVTILQPFAWLAYAASVVNPAYAVILQKQTVPRSFSANVRDTGGATVESIRGCDELAHVHELDRQSDTIQLLVDGQECLTVHSATGVPTGFQRMRIGASAITSGTPTSWLTGNVSDVVVKAGGLTANERKAVRLFIARHNPGIALLGTVSVISTRSPFAYNAWTMSNVHAGTRKLAVGWSSRPQHTTGNGGGLIIRTTTDPGDPGAWSAPINLRDVIPGLAPTDDLSLNGLGVDSSGGLIASSWYNRTAAPGLILRCPYDRDPALVSSWVLVASLTLPVDPSQINGTVHLPSLGLVAPWNRDHFASYSYGYLRWPNPDDLSTCTQVTLGTSPNDITLYANEFNYVALPGGRILGIGHRHITYDRSNGPFPLVQVTYDPGSGWSGTWVNTNITGAFQCPAWLTVVDSTTIEVVYFNRWDGQIKTRRGDINMVFGNPLAWGAETVLGTIATNFYTSGADSGYPSSALLRGRVAYAAYDGHRHQGTGPIVPNEQSNIVFMSVSAHG